MRGWAQELTGQRLCGRYLLGEVLGTGGMGAVFAGKHLKLGRDVAIKVIHPELADPIHIERFFREAQSAAKIGTGVVEVIDLDEDPFYGPFLVMEKLEGETLTALLKRGAVEPSRALRITGELLDVLVAVHERGIVHRDLKPANIFLHRPASGVEIVKVLDFGIARVLESDLTMPGQVIGTPRFMAPEQARGQDVDARADLYAAGLLFASLLTGLPPYADVPSSHVLEHVARGPGSMRQHLRASEPFHRFLDRALEPDPKKRFQTAVAMREALRALEAQDVAWDEKTIQDVPAVVVPPRKERRWMVRGLIVAASLALGAAATAVWISTRAPESVAPSEAMVRLDVPLGGGLLRVDGRDEGPTAPGRVLTLRPGPHILELHRRGVLIAQQHLELAAGDDVHVPLVPNVLHVEERLGVLEDGDDVLDGAEGRFVDWYSFEFAQGDELVITADSQDFDTLVVAELADTSEVQNVQTRFENDDYDGSNSLLDLTVTVTGRWNIGVAVFTAQESGDYRLRVETVE